MPMRNDTEPRRMAAQQRPIYPLPVVRVEPPASLTLGVALERYGPEMFPKSQVRAARLAHFRDAIASLLSIPVASITRAIADEVIRQHPSLPASEINRICRELRQLLDRVVAHRELSRNPLNDWERKNTSLPRNRSFTPEERQAIYAAALAVELRYREAYEQQDALRKAYGQALLCSLAEVPLASPFTVDVVFSMATGIPRNASYHLLHLKFDLSAGVLTLPATATRGTRLFPLTPSMRRFAAQWLAHRARPYVLDFRQGIPHEWPAVSCSVPDVRWQDLRSDFGNQLTSLGAPLWHVRYLMGLAPFAKPFPPITPMVLDELRASLALREAQCPLTLADLKRMAVQAR